MSVSVLTVECLIPGSMSLKDKRRVLASVVERLRRTFNAAVCETGHQNQWQRTQLAVVMVNTSGRMLQSSMAKVVELIRRERDLDLVSYATEQLA
jgi:uncharacterized protein YlxP (DUF503 family)